MVRIIPLILICFSVSLAIAGNPQIYNNQLIVKLKNPKNSLNSVLQKVMSSSRMQMQIQSDPQSLIQDKAIFSLKLENSVALRALIPLLRKSGYFEFVAPDYAIKMRDYIPNDPQFAQQWNMDSRNPASIEATAAWALNRSGVDITQHDVVMAIVDEGIDLAQQDIADNLWVNKGEIPDNNIDDDGNGYVDDINGWNSYTQTGKLRIGQHGTMVAGIAGARGDNGNFISGVSPQTKMLFVTGVFSSTSGVMRAYGYVIQQKKLWLSSGGQKGANVVVSNSSFGIDGARCSDPDYAPWNDLYNQMGAVGILSAVATTNQNVNVDQTGDVPSSCQSPYIITVTNTDQNNQLFERAGYGASTIDLSAPGTNVTSVATTFSIKVGTGTSFSTPHVTGAVALMHTGASRRFNSFYLQSPAQAALELRRMILQNVDPLPALQGRTVTGGKLNVFKSLRAIQQY